MQSVKECYLCRKDAEALGYSGELTSEGLDKHHVIYGTADRKLSEKTGLWVYLCKSITTRIMALSQSTITGR